MRILRRSVSEAMSSIASTKSEFRTMLVTHGNHKMASLHKTMKHSHFLIINAAENLLLLHKRGGRCLLRFDPRVTDIFGGLAVQLKSNALRPLLLASSPTRH
jgi:hypothetical protein